MKSTEVLNPRRSYIAVGVFTSLRSPKYCRSGALWSILCSYNIIIALEGVQEHWLSKDYIQTFISDVGDEINFILTYKTATFTCMTTCPFFPLAQQYAV